MRELLSLLFLMKSISTSFTFWTLCRLKTFALDFYIFWNEYTRISSTLDALYLRNSVSAALITRCAYCKVIICSKLNHLITTTFPSLSLFRLMSKLINEFTRAPHAFLFKKKTTTNKQINLRKRKEICFFPLEAKKIDWKVASDPRYQFGFMLVFFSILLCEIS